jgi:hypothetical protein
MPSSGGNVYFGNGRTDKTLVPYTTGHYAFTKNRICNMQGVQNSGPMFEGSYIRYAWGYRNGIGAIL